MRILVVSLILWGLNAFAQNSATIDPKHNVTTTVGNFTIHGLRSGSGGGLTNLAVAPMPSRHAYYLAPRTDGKPGSGTVNDPWDTSDAGELERVWYGIVWNRVNIGGVSITFLPGVYYASNQLQLANGSSNIVVSGYGARIFFTNPRIEREYTVFCSQGANDNCTWQGFEIDCGTYAGFRKSTKVCGVFAMGRCAVVRDLTIRNISSWNQTLGNGPETFGIIFAATNGICTGNIVDGISGSPIRGGTGIVIGGEGNTATGNAVNLRDTDGSDKVTSFGYSIYGNRNTFTGNTCQGVDVGISMDGGGGVKDGTIWRDNLISGNQFIANATSVRIENNNQGFCNWTWMANNFDTKAVWLSMWTGEVWRSNKISGHTFIGNQFNGPARSHANLILWNATNHTFIGNQFSVPPNLSLGTNANKMLGLGNTIDGVPNNAAFGVKATQ